jgi:hypothetical protein
MEDKMENSLVIITERLKNASSYIKTLCGDMMEIKPIADDKALLSVQENIDTLKKLKTAIMDYFKPIKAEAKKPYDAEIEKEKAWLKAVNDVFEFADSRVKDYNAQKRIEMQKRLQQEADERAAEEKKRLEKQAQELKDKGLEEAAIETMQTAQEVAPVIVPEVKMQSKGEVNTVTEKKKVVFFKIKNHQVCAGAMESAGLGGSIFLDAKTETAIKKYLDNNEEVTAFPGCEFQRDYVNSYRSK